MNCRNNLISRGTCVIPKEKTSVPFILGFTLVLLLPSESSKTHNDSSENLLRKPPSGIIIDLKPDPSDQSLKFIFFPLRNSKAVAHPASPNNGADVLSSL